MIEMGSVRAHETTMALNWAVQLLRLSVFSNAAIPASEKDWQAITGQEEAESRVAVPGGGKQFAGKFAGGQFSLTFAGQRLDVILQATGIDAASEMKLPVIAPWKELSDKFVDFMGTWLTNAHIPIVRIAFGAVLLAEAKTVQEAHEQLSELLESVTVDPKNMQDLRYRINWPSESATAPGLRLNRITTWASARVVRNTLQVSGGGEMAAIGGPSELRAVRLEIDHNTDANNTQAFGQASLVPIFRELVTMASENAEKGERP